MVFLGPLRTLLGPPRAPLGPSWGPSWRLLGPSGEPPAPLGTLLGGLLGLLGALSVPSWPLFGSFSAPFRVHSGPLGVTFGGHFCMFFGASFSEPFYKGLGLILEPFWCQVEFENIKNSERVTEFDGFWFSARDSMSEVVGGRFEPVLAPQNGT